MTSTTITLNVAPNSNVAPRAAVWLSSLAARVLGSLSPAVQKSDPAAEAARVRALAASYAEHDPRFADDLYAAADRHEMLNA